MSLCILSGSIGHVLQGIRFYIRIFFFIDYLSDNQIKIMFLQTATGTTPRPYMNGSILQSKLVQSTVTKMSFDPGKNITERKLTNSIHVKVESDAIRLRLFNGRHLISLLISFIEFVDNVLTIYFKILVKNSKVTTTHITFISSNL